METILAPSGISMGESAGAHVGDVRADENRIHVFSCRGRYAWRRRNQTDWNARNVLVGSDVGFMALRQDSTGRLHAVWSRSHRIMYSVMDPGQAWKEAKRVSPDTENNAEPSMDVDPDGNAHIVWQECVHPQCDWSDEHGAIWYRKLTYEELP